MHTHHVFFDRTLPDKNRLIKRVSPLLVFALVLPAFFVYQLFIITTTIHNLSLQLLLFIFLEANVVFADFMLWNYFRGRKKFRIWLIEIALILLILLLL